MALKLPVSSRIRTRLSIFPPALAKVGSYVNARPSLVLTQSVREIAQACKVGSATVIRFYREIGFQSLLELKIALASELEAQSRLLQETSGSVKVGDRFVQALEESRSYLREENVSKLALGLMGASRIYVLGEGTAQFSAQALAARLVEYDLPAFAVSAKGFEDAHRLDGSCVVIWYLGPEVDANILRRLRNIRKLGAFIATIPSQMSASIDKVSSVVLPAITELPSAALTHQFIIETLIAELAIARRTHSF
ncbi:MULTISPECIES: MurR/RpiR family transcriptional regulator [unclassified Neorhizobium]|uniref:MurR/RpiR family transcriptional regulator n=1 Tax=unclassified Neorhizobium TaxID=2629175 RepID=UPI001FF6D10F|nr:MULTISPECIES: MurR/RpiR family transcriptional regulator [unclassified Neorhizobium]MCJ9668996.1 MurR/RpiR family transcriptional regulator [Neorhizobium sp. SHOUNA12B]MCJ9744950.1 MurR/RpiR family transcriptional regulator [Neorhizobium sp. SHOUNA12A]